MSRRTLSKCPCTAGQAEDGNTRYSTEIQVQDFTFLSPKSDGSGQQQASNVGQAPAVKQQPQTPQQPTSDDNDDLPF